MNISLLKTSTVSFNKLFQIIQSIYCQSKKLSRQSLFIPLFVQLLNIYFFSKSIFFSFFQSMFRDLISDVGGGLVVKVSSCQIILYILHFAWLPILIFKIRFAISTFGNLLRNVQLKWFHFKHLSLITESVLMVYNYFLNKSFLLTSAKMYKMIYMILTSNISTNQQATFTICSTSKWIYYQDIID